MKEQFEKFKPNFDLLFQKIFKKDQKKTLVILKTYFILNKQKILYLMRWWLSAFVMMPIMIYLESVLPLWLNLLVGQTIGALIFWNIDKWIFKNKQ